jgi:hypothetical protein
MVFYVRRWAGFKTANSFTSMSVATSAAATAPTATAFAGTGITSAAARRGEGGKLLVQLAGTAMRTFRSAPVRRADEDFAVAPALLTMKFVNWHDWKIVYPGDISRRRISPFLSMASI